MISNLRAFIVAALAAVVFLPQQAPALQADPAPDRQGGPAQGQRGPRDREKAASPQGPRRPSQRHSRHDKPPERSMGWLFDRVGKVFGDLPSENQWAEAAQFISALSPSRWEVFQQVLNSPRRGERARRFIYARYKELKQLSQTDQDQYQAKLEQVRVEDEIFSLDTRLEQAQSPGEREDLRKEMRGKVQQLVERELADRERRIQRLQEKLDRERAALRKDRERMDEVVDRRVKGVHKASDRFRAWARSEGPGGDRHDERPRRSSRRGGPERDSDTPEGEPQRR